MSKALLPKKTVKGAPPKATGVKIENLVKTAPNELEQLNLKIPADKKMEMFIFGKTRGMTLTKLILAAYEEYKQNHQ